ncbi:hypothetical protein [Bartonella schoenbuchensis]|nr:hypothetical protein [Bartonella schoenbuchensis]
MEDWGDGLGEEGQEFGENVGGGVLARVGEEHEACIDGSKV